MPFSFLNKLLFYSSLLYYNVYSSIFECKNYQFKILLNEFYYLTTLLGLNSINYKYKKTFNLITIFGRYKIRDICWDIKLASPSFERLDINLLIEMISQSLKSNHQIVFVDVGAQFGKYTILIGETFKHQKDKVQILSFEPLPENFQFLQENIELNKLTNAKAFQMALSNNAGMKSFYYYEPQKMIVTMKTNNKISIKTDVLNSYTKYINSKKTDLYIKIDVEGHEKEVLEGSKKLIKAACKTFLLVEDSFPQKADELNNFLKKEWIFLSKLTSYNSFWKYIH